MAQRSRKAVPGWGTYGMLGGLATGLVLLIAGAGYFIAVQVAAERHYQAALHALERHDLDAARAHLARCLEVRSDSADVHFLAARTARRVGAYDEADTHLRTCKRLGGVPALIELEQALARVQRGDVESVETYLHACVQNDHPDATIILEALVRGYTGSYRLPQAETCLKLWLERDPNDVQALLWHGEAAERHRSHADALAAYERVVALAPEHAEARRKLAWSLFRAKRAVEAAEQYDWLRTHFPEDADALLGLARCYIDLGKQDETRQLLDAALAKQPKNSAVLHERGKLAMQQDQLDQAEGWLRRAVDAAPHDREAAYTLYQCLQRRGKNAEAKETLARLEQIEASLQRLGELTRQIAQTPRDADLRYEAGMIFVRNGQDVEGVRWLESALQENPRHAAAHQALAEAYQRLGRTDRADYHRRSTK